MTYHPLGDVRASGPASSVAYGIEPAAPMVHENLLRSTFDPRDLPWGIGEEANRRAREAARQRSTHRLTGHGQPWILLGSTSAAFQTFIKALRRIGVMASDEIPTRHEGDHNQKLYEQERGAAATIRAWNRFGRKHPWNITNLTDNIESGWTWDHGRFLRVHRDLWESVRRASKGEIKPWVGDSRGFVYLRGGTYPARDLLIDRVAKRLQNAGYLMRGPIDGLGGVVFTTSGEWRAGDNGAFIRALRNNLWAEAGSRSAYWPSGFNFGPTEGKNLRIHTALLNHLERNMLLGERRAMNKMLIKVIGPVRGGFPKVQ